jgi:CBS domain-containing protein
MHIARCGGENWVRVGSLCDRNVASIDAGASVLEAATLMRDRHTGYLVVTDAPMPAGVPTGVLLERDFVVKVLACGADTSALQVRHVMTPETLTASEAEEVSTVLLRMRSFGVRRLPVVDRDGRLCGVLSLDDIVDHLACELTDAVASIRNEQKLERCSTPGARHARYA